MYKWGYASYLGGGMRVEVTGKGYQRYGGLSRQGKGYKCEVLFRLVPSLPDVNFFSYLVRPVDQSFDS